MNKHTEYILGRLRSCDGFLSGEELCRQFGMTRSAVWKHISRLRNMGYGIEAVSGLGYRLCVSPELPVSAEVDPLLQTSRLGREIVFYQTTGSTNAEAKRLARAGAIEGVVVAADEQTGGRGRMMRRWISPPGANLYISLILRPDVPPARISQIPLLTAAALHHALRQCVPGLLPLVKWPNDILSGGRKLCGILCEMESETDMTHFVIVGIGINVNLREIPGEIRDIASSLLIESGEAVSRPQLLASFLNCFEPLYDEWTGLEDLGPSYDLLEEYSYLRGKTVEIEQFRQCLKGTAAGISRFGELLLDLDNGRRLTLSSGEARLSVKH
ncbi:biotin--[acetyl-CoA-carboxylase] ligase [Prosthecochloris sp. HL-130-GSB]|jgi:BirA family transcriptional regulator, biotin operon repressor / biotin---[acetyl-CoA-carboxylase] ligase|uniref:biotin--[acetyl-CoA-carboxylase] ligase n=1 Tax=Prosthecochloris sp. HL-130-GSB TaxID=1974213 RepID=UPI000A1C02FF|nr:biotin--[acetyl-CoA-carboxylase] ligase [Prosthecochloris sp. HL-130-GSB]ARM31689.1 biotin--[acetyl-CoA-carboxylase] ligase [Prosthecochloris sp. HL-130-GSB]MBO8093062.1 biotin--[acetyl-CoA-carboxylase] ligase [Prosthecochloris sp.]